MATQTLNTSEYEEKIINQTGWSLLDFWRDDCTPCKNLSAELEVVSRERPAINIYKVNVEDGSELAEKLRVMAAPTLFFFKDGEIKKKTIGYKSASSILQVIDDADTGKEN